MINKNLSNKIITLGYDCKKPKGGVARVLNSYKHYVFNKFNFISTTKNVNGVFKLLILIKAALLLTIKCLSGTTKIVHIHGSSYNSFWRKRILINIARFFNKKIVYHIHGAEFHLFYEANKDVVKKTLDKADAIITLSESWKNFFEQEVGAKNVYVVPNITPYIPQSTKRQITKKSPIQITFIGTLCKRKGLYDIIYAVADKREAFDKKIIINLCGNGEIANAKRIIKEKGLEQIINCIGPVNSSEIYTFLENSDIYILPSYNEGLPISVLEAMSHGLPIISTPVGGIPEVVKDGENGFLITPGDKEALFNAIITLATDEEMRKEMGKISYQKVLKHFPENVSEKLERIYNDLII